MAGDFPGHLYNKRIIEGKTLWQEKVGQLN